MVGIEQVRLGHELHQLLLHLHYVFPASDTGAVTDPEYMRIHGHGQLSKGGVEHHVGGLAAHAWQGFQRFTSLRYFAAMLFNEQTTGFNHILGLAVVKADGLDVFRQPFNPQGIDGFGGIGHGK